jgi:hypothetical protein
MTLQDLRKYAKETIEKHPEHKKDIVGLYQLCLDEIEEGGSREQEIENCLHDIKELLNGE